MASRPSIVFLFDLDLSKFKTQEKNSEIENENHMDPSQSCAHLIRYVCLSILNYFSEKQVNIQWGYRFYSSSNYQLTSKAQFIDLTSQSVEDFEEALDLHYEQNLPNSVAEAPYSACTSKAGILNRTLQDIVSDFDWKTPTDTLTPTRRAKKTGKQLDQNLQNLVFIFTQVPADDTIRSFCQLEKHTQKIVTECILPKELTKRFHEFQLSLNFVDFAYAPKTIFDNIVQNFQGSLINPLALASPFSVGQIFKASRTATPTSSEECLSCQTLQLTSKVFIQTTSLVKVELGVQCWNQMCTRSSLSHDVNVDVPVIKCVPVLSGQVPSRNLLRYETLYLLSSRKNLSEEFHGPRVLWVGSWNGRVFAISSLTHQAASMIFPSPDSSYFYHWKTLLTETVTEPETEDDQQVASFIERIISSHRNVDSKSNSLDNRNSSQWTNLKQLKGNYLEKKATHIPTHWQMLKDCFQDSENGKPNFEKEFNNNCFDQLATVTSENVSSGPTTSSNELVLKKIGKSRIQNLRASQLLQKSQEVRARNDELEREKLNKEKQEADSRKEKKWKEWHEYLQLLRQSIAPAGNLIQLVPSAGTTEQLEQPSKAEILERCLTLKTKGLETENMEDWQWLCLVQVIASTILYVWKEPPSLESAYETLRSHFLKNPTSISRTTTKENKIQEYKFQIILRLETSWMVPGLNGVEEEVLQDTTSLLQLLSIHSTPKIMSSFYQDALIVNYENMLPEFLVNLGEELNQPIPTSLSELIHLSKSSRRTPSPALSSRTLSVQSITSQQEIIANDSQRPTRDLRSRTLSRQPSITIQHKKQIALPTKAENKTAAPTKKQETTAVGRVRRSLHFEVGEPSQASKHRENKSKTPLKQLESSLFSLQDLLTPSKATDLILAPETPSRLRSGGKSSRKTDGVHIVGESPEIKQEVLKRSPRRLQAALALRRRASFYSSLNGEHNQAGGSGSRHWARAESQVWSEKARASVSMATEDNSPRPVQSAQYLFSKILSRNDSNVPEPSTTPKKNVFDSNNQIQQPPMLSTPLKSIPGSSLKTPLKTPKLVQFNLQFQPATPSSKTIIPCARSILKSPAFQSPRQQSLNRTPHKNDALLNETPRHHLVQVLDATNFGERDQLELSSPVKEQQPQQQHNVEPFQVEAVDMDSIHDHSNDLVFKLDAQTLQADEEIHLQSPVKAADMETVSPVKLRRSPRVQTANSNASCNFFQRNPNWTVIDYRRLNAAEDDAPPSKPCSDELIKDPYDFIEEDMEKEETGGGGTSFFNDSSGHKRKLFQCSAEKRPSIKKRKLMPSPIQESLKTTPKQNKFQTPLESSLFHLENSPLFNSLESKFKDQRYKRD